MVVELVIFLKQGQIIQHAELYVNLILNGHVQIMA